jgi:hypothetical protein
MQQMLASVTTHSMIRLMGHHGLTLRYRPIPGRSSSMLNRGP